MPAARYRLDIQGLRGLAVLLVVAYHLAPGAVPGGFVGVDIFFVLSGFLITGILLGPHRGPTPRIRSFLVRRARRLLPAAGVVVTATLTAGLLVLPPTRWNGLAAEAIASSGQVENWLLAFTTAEYSAAEFAGPLQHFWSLSVEWQTYAVWNVLFAVATATGRYRRRVAVIATIVVVALSLGATIASTGLGSELRYYATPLRLWEFGAGAIIAFLPTVARSRRVREVLAGTGALAVIAGAFLLDADGHPGLLAVIPVAGTAALLEAGRSGDPSGTARALAAAPLRIVGDHSYAIYLWHWPILVLMLASTGVARLDPAGIVFVVVATGVLAVISTRWLENPVRRSVRPRRALLIAGAATILPVLLATPVLIGVNALRSAAPDPDHPGALAIDPVVAAQLPDVPFIPDVSVAGDDRGDAGAGQRCLTAKATPIVCTFGDREADRVIVVVGDSHAWQWVSTLDVLGQRNGWRIESLVRRSCPLAPTPLEIPGVVGDDDCSLWRENAVRLLEQTRPDIVLVTGLTPAGYETIDYHVADVATFARGYARIWDQLAAAGIAVAAIRDTPYFPIDVPECVAASLDAPEVCDRSRDEVLDAVEDPLVAASAASGIPLIDLSDSICLPDSCPVVVGNVLVYRDRHHLTATYAQTLEPALSARLRELGLLD